jgi:hypothetical protein
VHSAGKGSARLRMASTSLWTKWSGLLRSNDERIRMGSQSKEGVSFPRAAWVRNENSCCSRALSTIDDTSYVLATC